LSFLHVVANAATTAPTQNVPRGTINICAPQLLPWPETQKIIILRFQCVRGQAPVFRAQTLARGPSLPAPRLLRSRAAAGPDTWQHRRLAYVFIREKIPQ
jgi:hypothetical protein